MLSTNLPLMKNSLNSLLLSKEGNPFYDAAYKAYYESNKCIMDSASIDDDPSGIANRSANEANEKLKDRAAEFAKEFCNILKNGGLMDSIADEIDKHIKSMLLTINIPALLPTIISPTGPCTGSLSISEATGAQIIIQ